MRPYFAPEVPPARLANSGRLSELVRAGNLYLTVQDAIALALENNVDIEVARYNPLVATWNVTRAKARRGIAGRSKQRLASRSGGQRAGRHGRRGSHPRIVPGPVRTVARPPTPPFNRLAPSRKRSIHHSGSQHAEPHQHAAAGRATEPNTNLVTDTRASTVSYQQDHRRQRHADIQRKLLEREFANGHPEPVLRPEHFHFVQHNFLQGFGVAVNARTITVAKMNIGISDLTFQTQVVNVVAQVLNAYYGLTGAIADVKAKREAAEVAQTFFANVKEQARLGSLSPSEAINAEAQLVSSRLDLVNSEATLTQQELQLKNLISRAGTGDTVLSTARIVPVDPIVIPDKDDLPPLEDMVKQALAKRTDLAAERQNEAGAEVTALGTRTGSSRAPGVFASTSQSGLSGTGHTVSADGISEAPDPYFVGGIGKALGQVFRRDFPSESVAGFYAGQLRNRQALADYAIDQLQFRQTQLTTRKDLNQVEVDIQNYAVALRQARARYDAAVRNRILQQELFSSERRRSSWERPCRSSDPTTARPADGSIDGDRGPGFLQHGARGAGPDDGRDPGRQSRVAGRSARGPGRAKIVHSRDAARAVIADCCIKRSTPVSGSATAAKRQFSPASTT